MFVFVLVLVYVLVLVLVVSKLLSCVACVASLVGVCIFRLVLGSMLNVLNYYCIPLLLLLMLVLLLLLILVVVVVGVLIILLPLPITLLLSSILLLLLVLIISGLVVVGAVGGGLMLGIPLVAGQLDGSSGLTDITDPLAA